jgi:hypothetical protein
MPAVNARRLVEDFADRLAAVDLPALPAERRAAASAFAGRRYAGLPTPMRAGVTVVAVAVAVAGRVAGCCTIARTLAHHPLPVVGDYVRLVRALTTAYVWETWPTTAADGTAR